MQMERYLLKLAAPLHGLGVTQVTRRDVGNLLAAVTASSGSVSANRLRGSLSTFFAWCIERGITEQNPVMGAHVAPEPPRERVLAMDELALIWKAFGTGTYGSIVKLLMLTRAGPLRSGAFSIAISRATRSHCLPTV
jgi:hypothetical protein